jgi:hypothetical protein
MPESSFSPAKLHAKYVDIANALDFENGHAEGTNSPQAEDISDRYDDLRKGEAKRITDLLNANDKFSFLRLGDMELTLMLANQDGLTQDLDTTEHETPTGTTASGSPGIGLRYAKRLKSAFEGADYVDFHEVLRMNRILLPRLNLNRNREGTNNPGKWTSYILPLWVSREFRSFCDTKGRRCGIAGAEASILEWLSDKDRFLQAAEGIWPKKNRISFHQVRNNGKGIDTHLDVIKEDLLKFIDQNDLDTLFLSLGGGAKILCHELSRECNIRAVDFGAMIRSLCDIGSDGNSTSRSTHSVQLYRLPSSLVMEGLFSVRGNLKEVERLSLMHAQLIHQLLPDRVAYSRGNSQLDFGKNTRNRFKAELKECKQKFPYVFRVSTKECRLEAARFLHFCGRNNLTLKGRFFYYYFLIKRWVYVSLTFVFKGNR